MNMSSYCPMSCKDGWSSLMAASRYGHVEVVDKLLQHGVTVDLESKVRSLQVEKSFLQNERGI